MTKEEFIKHYTALHDYRPLYLGASKIDQYKYDYKQPNDITVYVKRPTVDGFRIEEITTKVTNLTFEEMEMPPIIKHYSGMSSYNLDALNYDQRESLFKQFQEDNIQLVSISLGDLHNCKVITKNGQIINLKFSDNALEETFLKIH
jgi:hypothetical protein